MSPKKKDDRQLGLFGGDDQGDGMRFGKPVKFDKKKTRKARDQGMNRAEAHAPDEWNDRALEVVRVFAQSHESLIVDDLWRFIEEPPEPRAMGPVLMRAARAGFIARTGELVASERVTSHGNHRSVWRSLIFESS